MVETVDILNVKILVDVPPSDRVLLISQCLRPSKICKGTFGEEGLKCVEDCSEACVVHQLRETALKLGYRGVCVAAGGSMALRYVKDHGPKGIVAVACPKELKEGVKGVKDMLGDSTPPIVIVPLTKEGCVDTEVDVDQAMSAIKSYAIILMNTSK
jgi:hypothetical protein